MVQPINYMAGMQQPNIKERLLGGIQSAVSLAELKKSGELQKKNEAFKTDFANMLKSPSWQNSMDLVAKYPEFADKIQAAKKLYSDEENRLDFDYAVKSFRAATTGNVDIAKKLTQERIDAKRNSGQSFEEDMQILKALDSNPNAAAGIIGAMGAAADPSKWEAIAKASQSQDLAKAQREQAQITVKKLGTEIGLTEAQIKQAEAATAASRAAANKSGAEAERARAEAEQMARGVMPVEKRAEAETKLRKEYIDNTKDFSATQDAYRKITAAEDTAAGDISLIFSYMKMLDPGSVVREGEFATAQNAAGVPERVLNLYNQAISGERLNDKQRNMFTNQAEKLYDASAVREKQVRDGLTRIGQGYGLNLDNVFYQPGGVEKPQRPPKPSAGPVAGSGAVDRTPAALPSEFSAPGVVPTGGGTQMPAGFRRLPSTQ